MSKIEFSSDTISILKNFSQINQSLVFREGNVLATISLGKTVLAKASIAENVEADFAIYDMSKFLSVLSLFDSPTLKMNDDHVTISSGKKKVNYKFADLSLFTGKDKIDPYSKEIKLPSIDVEFNLTKEIFADVKKALGVLRLPEIAVVGDGETIAIEAIDSKNSGSDVYSIDLGETDKTFRFIFKEENLKLLPQDYTVQISSKCISKFTGSNVTYDIAVEKTSTFEG